MRHLDLYDCTKMEPAGLRALAQAELPELETVNLRGIASEELLEAAEPLKAKASLFTH